MSNNVLRETVELINGIRRRVQIRRMEDSNFQTQNVLNEISINIELSNNIVNSINDLMTFFGNQLIDNDLNYEEYVNLPNEKIVLNENEFDEKIKLINDEIECGICKDKFNLNCVELEICKHKFCKNCIKEWLTKYSVNCPICRKDTRE